MNYQQPRPEIHGWMNPEELEWLYNRAQEMQSIIEVGCWRGRSTHALLSGCPGPVYAVDHWKGSASELDGEHKDARTQDIFEQFMRNVGHFSNLKVVRMDSVSAALCMEPADMVFIDAEHTVEAVRADRIAWMPKARKILCGHDYPMQSVNRALSGLAKYIEEPKHTGLWVINMQTLPQEAHYA